MIHPCTTVSSPPRHAAPASRRHRVIPPPHCPSSYRHRHRVIPPPPLSHTALAAAALPCGETYADSLHEYGPPHRNGHHAEKRTREDPQSTVCRTGTVIMRKTVLLTIASVRFPAWEPCPCGETYSWSPQEYVLPHSHGARAEKRTRGPRPSTVFRMTMVPVRRNVLQARPGVRFSASVPVRCGGTYAKERVADGQTSRIRSAMRMADSRWETRTTARPR